MPYFTSLSRWQIIAPSPLPHNAVAFANYINLHQTSINFAKIDRLEIIYR